MKRNRLLYYTGILIVLLAGVSCRKEFLETKPDASLVVPQTIEDFQAILDNVRFMNGSSAGTYGVVGFNGGPNPQLLETATDNYYIPDNFLSTFLPYYKSVYTWDKEDPYAGQSALGDWNQPYQSVFYANQVLDGLKTLARTESNAADWDRIKASALFFRAHAFYGLAQIYAGPYDKDQAKNLLGIPLRLSADISEKSVRATLEETYSRILADLREAGNLMPSGEPLYRTRPSLPVIYGLLARTYLTMSDFTNAKLNAEKCLTTYNKALIDYNTLSSTSTYPIPRFNNEVIFSSIIGTNPNTFLFSVTYCRIDNDLYNSYASNDLRKDLFFRLRETNAYSFRGSYDGNAYPFAGVATDEMYLILAESLTRLHDVPGGLNYLNQLLKNRYKLVGGVSSFTPYSITDEEQALKVVLTERRKELLMRSLRFTDLRRLNRDPRFAITIKRVVAGQTISLPPNDPRYTWPVPSDVIGLSGMQQNPR